MGTLGDIREANVGMWSHVNCRGPPLILPSCIELVGDAPKTLHWIKWVQQLYCWHFQFWFQSGKQNTTQMSKRNEDQDQLGLPRISTGKVGLTKIVTEVLCSEHTFPFAAPRDWGLPMGLSLLSGFYKYYVPIIYITHSYIWYIIIYIIYQLIIAYIYIYMYHTHRYIFTYHTHTYIYTVYIHSPPSMVIHWSNCWSFFFSKFLERPPAVAALDVRKNEVPLSDLTPTVGVGWLKSLVLPVFFGCTKNKLQQIELNQLWWRFFVATTSFQNHALTWEMCRACRVELRFSYPEPDFHIVGCWKMQVETPSSVDVSLKTFFPLFALERFLWHLFGLSQLIHPTIQIPRIAAIHPGLYAAASIGGLNAPGLYFIVRSLRNKNGGSAPPEIFLDQLAPINFTWVVVSDIFF